MKTNLKKLEKSQLEVDFELDEQEFNRYIDKALERLKGHLKIDGFRPGNVPKEIVEKQVGQENLLMEAGDLAVKEIYVKFVKENSLEPIGQPEVQIKKIAKGNPFLFKVKISVLPDIELPDYKVIASKVKARDISVEDKEIEEAINYLQKSRAKFTDKSSGAEKSDYIKIEYSNENINSGKSIRDIFILGQGGFLKDFEDNLLGMKTGDEKEFEAKFPENAPNGMGGKDGKFKVKMLAVQIMNLPEINDEFAKSMGVFDSLAKLKENLREGITMEKQESERQRKRGEILEKISQKVFDSRAPILNKIGARPSTQSETLSALVPEKMVEYEQARLFEDLKNQIAQNVKVDFGEYLKSIKKTEEEIKKSFKLDAEKRIKNFLVLRQISKTENIEVSNEELEVEMNKVIKNYSKEQLDKIDIESLKEYNKIAILNEKVFQLLENLSQ